MQINLWMVADLLRKEGTVVESILSGDQLISGISLKARPGRLCLRAQGKDVICSAGSDRIVLHGATLPEAMEQVEQVFDRFSDWHDEVLRLCRQESWQKLIDAMEPFFTNPIVLFDANMRVVSMSSRFAPGTVDEEWEYLRLYGVSSDRSIRAGRSNPRFLESLRVGSGVFYTAPQAVGKPEYLTICIRNGGEPWGYLSSVSAVCPFYRGEVETARLLGELIGENLPPYGPLVRSAPALQAEALRACLTMPYSECADEVRRILRSYGWEETDTCRVVCAALSPEERPNRLARMFAAVTNSIEVPCVTLPDRLVVLLNAESPLFREAEAKLLRLTQTFDACAAFSLLLDGAHNLRCGYEQTCFVIERTAHGSGTHYFADHAIAYMVTTSDRQSLLAACHGGIRRLMLSGGKSRELADTLEIYLENERSLNKTAAEQKLHKNTISYRVQRSLEQTGIDPDDPHQRLYALFSFSVIRTIEETAEGSLNHT